MDRLRQLDQAFQSLRSEMWVFAKEAKDQDTVDEDIRSIDIGLVDSFQTLRAVVRKHNKKLYITGGLYEKLREGWHWNGKRTIRLDFLDDLEGAIEKLETLF